MAEFCVNCLRRRDTGECACDATPEPETVASQEVPLPRRTPRRTKVPFVGSGDPRFPVYSRAPTIPPVHSGSRAVARGLVVAAVILVVVAAAVTTGVLVAVDRMPAVVGVPVAGDNGNNETGGSDGSGTRLPATAAPPLATDAPATVTGASASCTSGPGVDSAGTPFTYEAGNAVDRRPETAWRCDHDGVGARLSVTFAQPAVIGWIGVVPGFAKTDPYDGTDRYLQGRKVSSARFVFDGGYYVECAFDTSSTSRAMQMVRFPPTTTGHVDMIVLGSVPGTPTNGFTATDKIAVSELAVGR